MQHKRQSTSCKRLLLLTILLFFFTVANQSVMGQNEQVQDQLAQQKFEFERDMENRKLKLEWGKAILIAASIALPLIGGLYSIHKQVKTAFAIKQVEARNSFELKAAELLLNSKTPGQLQAKAKALMKLFPTAPLPSNFAESVEAFDPDKYSGPSTEWKLELFKVLTEPTRNREVIIKLWKEIFPEDEWIERLSLVQALPAQKSLEAKKESPSDSEAIV